MAIYFSIATCQPFAKLVTEPVEGFEGVESVTADGAIVGLRLEDPRSVVRLDEIIDTLNLSPDRMWAKLRADNDPVRT